MNLKVLQLENWMKYFRDEDLQEIPALLDREGYYKLGDLCWFEVEGKAYLQDVADFDHDLSIFNIRLLRDCEYTAVNLLIKNKIADSALKELFYINRHYKELINIRRRSKLDRLKIGI